jgi:hypothetical protein
MNNLKMFNKTYNLTVWKLRRESEMREIEKGGMRSMEGTRIASILLNL